MGSRRTRRRFNVANREALPDENITTITSFNISFTISDIDSDNNPISDSNEAEDIGFFANSITDIEITDIELNGEIINDLALLPEASLLVEQSFLTFITYTFVDSEGIPLGISEADGSIVSIEDLNDQDIQVLSFPLELENVDANQATNSLEFIIEEDLLSSPSNEILGTNQSDNLEGGDADEIISGLQGDDTLRGNGGNDDLSGDSGNDLLAGGDGNDFLDGGDNDDVLNGDAGNDFLDGGNGNDTIFGGADDDRLDGLDGADFLDGDDGNDDIFGASGNDTLSGNNGNDTLSGENNDDVLNGDDGNDLLRGGFGRNILNGGAGADSFELADPNGSVFNTVTDFNRSEGDQFRVTGNQSDYTLIFGNSTSDPALDTLIQNEGNTIAIVEDTTTVDLNTDFLFL